MAYYNDNDYDYCIYVLFLGWKRCTYLERIVKIYASNICPRNEQLMKLP